MKPIRSTRNQYQGINAHLHSLWQAEGGWARFHTNHMTDLLRTLRPVLYPLGYEADIETSLQIRRIDDVGKGWSPESDITIFDLDVDRAQKSKRIPSSAPATAERTMPIPEALFGQALSEKQYSAIQIYRYKPDTLDRGEPVAWLELLSPSNKPPGSDAKHYFSKRLELLMNGLVFIELDYLHETDPTIYGVPSYRRLYRQQVNASAAAYRIIVFDPRPNLDDGITHLHEFETDTIIPKIEIPLSGEDKIHFDFDAAYQKTLLETFYAQRWVDYSQLPLNFEAYHPIDQTRIARRMLAVLEAAHAGIDLESGQLPVKEIALEDALTQIDTLKAKLETS